MNQVQTPIIESTSDAAPPARAARSIAPKILLYSHDTYGLGNIRRTLLLAETILDEYSDAALLIVTGSPMIHAFRIPEQLDYIKLPCLDRTAADKYTSKFLPDQSSELVHLRRLLLEKSILGFAPDLLIVDKRPAGIGGELLPALRVLGRRPRATRLVLGIRDILDEPSRTRQSLKRMRDFSTIARYYDEVWIYGERSMFDSVAEYAFPQAVARKTRFCGYLERPTQFVARRPGPPRVLVTTGGGGDGSELIRTYLEGLVTVPPSVPIETTVIFGPQVDQHRKIEILERFGTRHDVSFLEFEPDLSSRYADADLVVCMAGYNTVCELLSWRRRAVLVPRGEPVAEQLLRARRFAARGLFDIVEPDALEPQVLVGKVLSALAQPPAGGTAPVDLDGLTRIRQRVRCLLGRAPA